MAENFIYTPDTTEADVKAAKTRDSPAVTKDSKDDETVSWQASEFIEHSKTTSWYIYLGVGAAILAATMFVITRSWLVILVITLSAIAIGQLARTKPRTNDYSLTVHGLTINGVFHPLSDFRSYSIYKEGAINVLHFESAKRFANPVTIYFSPAEEKAITSILGKTMSQDVQKHSPLDKVVRKTRF